MKQLEITTNKRLLIVEYPDDRTFKESLFFFTTFKTGAFEQYFVKLICKGSDLTEDIAKGFLHQSIYTGLFPHYVKGIPVNTYCYKTAIEAFDAVINSYDYHWGENPVKEPVKNTDLWGFPYTRFKYHCNMIDYEEAQSKTFNPSKCIIFEIV